MRRLARTWRSWSRARRLTVAGTALALVVVGGIVAYSALKRPADVSNPGATFHKKQKQPERARKKNPRATDWPLYGYNAQRTRYLPARNVRPPFSKPLWTFDAGKLLEFSP